MSEPAPDRKPKRRWYAYQDRRSYQYQYQAWVFAFSMLFLAALVGWISYPTFAHSSLHRRIGERIRSLHNQRPGNITPERWEEAVDWAYTAFSNLPLGSPDNRSPLKDFDSDLKEKMAAGDSLETLRWIWDELERSTPRGPSYAASYRPVRAMTPEPITNETLKNLWGAKTAIHLDLSDTEVGDAGLIHLSSAQNLVVLDLTNTQVTDAGLVHLKALTKLEHLYLDNTQVTDAGLAHLQGLNNLESLLLNGTQVTDAGAGKLRQALPDCDILCQPGTTNQDGGLTHQ